ncbi:membrane protease subunit (stomatin/prohibitin family) [Fontibacillus phaseoli]|uniref:Membrane protease subunit (Stomatin/prohibitin family) n=1 Tax=Fontibacillus phaseoli TaxID=1416533 RepID=A0A369AVS4_9BACL|nr:SPFH domain-containing protein [Fontibacillus phaseoli]RCX13301.1 membrane protease subunit (stomatin/prohibitin family) [Fontibacillus phaseoli]
MGLFSFLKGQFIEVIEWLDESANSGTMVYRFPVYDNAIKMGAKLIVRESQAAVFVNEGQIADVYGPGTYTLSTQNMPLLTALKSWPHAFNSPFKADVYFVSTTNFTNLKWGTTNPVILRDTEFGAIRLRGFGNYAFRVKEPALFLKELFGTRSDFTTEQISGHLKSILVTGISDLIGESRIPVMDLASSYEELSAQAMERLQPHFESMGLFLSLLLIENLSLPPEVEQMIDRKSSMNIAGNLDQYMKYQTAEAIREAANNPDSGAAGTGAGLGAGMAMAQMMGQMMNRPAEPGLTANGGGPAAAGNDPGAGSPKRFCSECGSPLAENAKFCSGCGTKV